MDKDTFVTKLRSQSSNVCLIRVCVGRTTPSCHITTDALNLIHADAAHSSLSHSFPSVNHLYSSDTFSISQGVTVTAFLLQLG